MCRATNENEKTIGGYESILQSLASYHMHLPYFHPTTIEPLVCRWSDDKVLNFINISNNNILRYKSMIDHIQGD